MIIWGFQPWHQYKKSTFCFSFSVQMCLFFSTKLKSASCSRVKTVNFFFACGKKHMFYCWKRKMIIWSWRKHITLIKLVVQSYSLIYCVIKLWKWNAVKPEVSISRISLFLPKHSLLQYITHELLPNNSTFIWKWLR